MAAFLKQQLLEHYPEASIHEDNAINVNVEDKEIHTVLWLDHSDIATEFIFMLVVGSAKCLRMDAQKYLRKGSLQSNYCLFVKIELTTRNSPKGILRMFVWEKLFL